MQVERSEIERALSLLGKAKELHATWPINPFTFLNTPSVDLAAMRRHHLSRMLGDVAYEEAEVSERPHVDIEGKGRFYEAELVVMSSADFAALKIQLRNLLELGNPAGLSALGMSKHPELEALLQKAKDHVMTDEELRAQRISFVYGNLMDCAPHLTKEDVEQIHDKIYGGPRK